MKANLYKIIANLTRNDAYYGFIDKYILKGIREETEIQNVLA